MADSAADSSSPGSSARSRSSTRTPSRSCWWWAMRSKSPFSVSRLRAKSRAVSGSNELLPRRTSRSTSSRRYAVGESTTTPSIDPIIDSKPSKPVTSTRSGAMPTRSRTAAAARSGPPAARALLMRSSPSGRVTQESRGIPIPTARPPGPSMPMSWMASVLPCVTAVAGTRVRAERQDPEDAVAEVDGPGRLDRGQADGRGLHRRGGDGQGDREDEGPPRPPARPHGDTSAAAPDPSSSATSYP